MKNIFKRASLALLLVSTTCLSSASAVGYELNTFYSALGSIRLYDTNGVFSTQALEVGSYIQFDGNGNFNYRFDTALGVVQGVQTFNMDHFLANAPELALLTPAGGMNLGNGYTSHGVFTPDLGVSGFSPFTFIASAMNNVFRLNSSNGSFTIWNAQYSSTGALLGNTDFWLTTGAETHVPEPMTLGLLGAGLAGIASRRKKNLA